MSAQDSSVAYIVVTDTNILINLIHVNRIDLLGKLPPYSFVVPEQVVAEVTNPLQASALKTALKTGLVQEVRLTELSELRLYGTLIWTLGSGEAACLALAQDKGWLIASDERKTFFREAVNRLGTNRILNTAGILIKAIKLGV